MTPEFFESVFKEEMDRLWGLAVVKGKEYARGDMRDSNFLRQAVLNFESPLEALRGNMSKHTEMLYSLLEDEIKQNRKIPYERWQEVIGDEIVYRLLLLAMVKDHLAKMSNLEASLKRIKANLKTSVENMSLGKTKKTVTVMKPAVKKRRPYRPRKVA